MRYPDTDDVKQLTQKLQEQNDITLEESDWIYSLYSPGCRKTKISSSQLDMTLIAALEEYYKATACKIKQGHRGNFLFSIFLDTTTSNVLGSAINNVLQVLSECACLEEFFIKLSVSAKLYLSFPTWFQQLFTKTTEKGSGSIRKTRYTLHNQRLGAYYYPIETEEGAKTIAQLIKRFVPVTRMPDKGGSIFEITTGLWNLSKPSIPWWMNRHKDGYQEVYGAGEYVVGTYLGRKKVPLVLMENRVLSYDRHVRVFFPEYVYTFFTEKDQVKLVKDVLEVSFKDMVENALYNNIIDKQTAKYFVDNNTIFEHLFKEFVETSIEYVDRIVQNKIEWKATREAVATEWSELEER